jgi:hypothetical protein
LPEIDDYNDLMSVWFDGMMTKTDGQESWFNRTAFQ